MRFWCLHSTDLKAKEQIVEGRILTGLITTWRRMTSFLRGVKIQSKCLVVDFNVFLGWKDLHEEIQCLFCANDLQKYFLFHLLTCVTSSINDFKQFRTAWFHYYIILIHSQAVRCSTTEDHLSSKVRMIDIWWSVFWRDKLLNFFRNKSDWQNTKPMIDNRHLNSLFNRTWDDILMAASFMFTH